jgi:hypothetical protein
MTSASSEGLNLIMGRVRNVGLQLQFVFQLDDSLPGLKASAEFAFVEGFNDKVICSTLDLLWTRESQHVKATSGPFTLVAPASGRCHGKGIPKSGHTSLAQACGSEAFASIPSAL